ncbi:modification methylase [Comamonas kerstersii]|mgnify:CR=1 FL=1|uniref:DNA (cytosine-5-)-methyltransferase n=1 Tax=Comamonas kerstersii TaxID=225992 RepID=A0A0W7YTI2_9BURK|nr:modification methylase [Comamonas kerstersii]
MRYRVVDLFAGPGGLGEGFAAYDGGNKFEIVLSAEMEESAHKTLTMRAFFRRIRGDERALAAYYAYCHSEKAPHPSTMVKSAWEDAKREACQLILGDPEHNRRLDELLKGAALSSDETILIGGPPCQAYSLVGRARNKGKANYKAEDDHRHFLYREYLRIVQKTQPAIFVMENVKGILSSTVGGQKVFHDILRDLSDPGAALKKAGGAKYVIHSLVAPVSFRHGEDPAKLDLNGFIIESERYGIPQARHRVILLGVREDIPYSGGKYLKPSSKISVHDAIGALPALRSRLSKEDSPTAWRDEVISRANDLIADALEKDLDSLAFAMLQALDKVGRSLDTGGLRCHLSSEHERPINAFLQWVKDPRLEVWLNHESRSHMPSDLGRYFYTAAYGAAKRRTPKGHLEFALKGLAPEHANWQSGKFIDRFRVQLRDHPSTTVTSHIAKDGHYFIHYDPTQCRSLTVREAARLQTFPDNYFFQGTRTQQFHQVGNAVPSLLANKIAHVVYSILTGKA